MSRMSVSVSQKGGVDLPPEADTVKNEAVATEKEKDYGKTMYTELDASGMSRRQRRRLQKADKGPARG